MRQLQRRLWAASKRSSRRRFHALYDRIWRRDVLQEAWRRVRRNKGAAGVDRQTLEAVESYGVDRFLEEIHLELRAGSILDRLGLKLHPGKTRRVDLSRGRQGFDFLGCHLRKRMSGLIWERDGRRVYFLQREPSQRSMKRVRARVKELTGAHRSGVKDLRVILRDLNRVLRGWGNYFRTGNAARKLNQVDWYVVGRLRRFLVRRKGRHLRAGEAEGWTRPFFESLGLYRLRGTVQYPQTPFWRMAQ